MKSKDPVNIFNDKKYKEVVSDSSHLVSIKAYKNSYNITKPFVKPISKIF
ncbi:hypothetical protein ATE84_0691 [Aquimarina sp. MAR_2010_214]|nr:hypothetical protein [Aquimarina sp. MAR_2010_214]PKV48685.1 hypothetical protein ATE84_0691 [Aquimarina sp. MAR_2010_214]